MKPFYVAVANYAATGEGHTMGFALGDSEAHAKRTLQKHMDPFFADGADVRELTADDDLLKYFPPAMLKLARQLRTRGECLYDVYTYMHYNLS